MDHPRSLVSPCPDVVLVKSLVVPFDLEGTFDRFVDPSLLEGWLCERAVTEPRLGGRYELFWGPDPEYDSTIGCLITAYEPPVVLGFQWRSPRQFRPWTNGADPLTYVVVSFHPEARGTRVVLVHSGWRSSPQWLEAARWQDRAWEVGLGALGAPGPP